MSYPLNYPTPQNANVQIFYARSRTTPTTNVTATWVKPQGASFVWFTLIGAGAGGDGTDGTFSSSGGVSGEVTNAMLPAFLLPDTLQIRVGIGGTGGGPGATAGTAGTPTIVYYQQKAGTGYEILNSSANTPMTAAGFYQFVAADNSSASVAPATSFLKGGGYRNENYIGNYGYSMLSGSSQFEGFFQMQPIIVGLGGSTNTSYSAGDGGIGCGGAGLPNTSGGTYVAGNGGNGLAVIITW